MLFLHVGRNITNREYNIHNDKPVIAAELVDLGVTADNDMRHTRSFKVTDLGSNRKPVCDIAVNNTNSHSLPCRFQDTRYYRVLVKLLLSTGGTFI